MCYASPVMLRGLCSCAVLDRPVSTSGTQTPRPTPLSAPRLLVTSHSPLATALVSPLFPLLTRNRPVTPLFPLLTQKQGGGGTFNQMIFTNALLRLSIPGGSNRLEISAPNFEPSTLNLELVFPGKERPASEGGLYTNSALSTVNSKRTFLSPAFTTTSINIVGPPTIFCPNGNPVMPGNFADAGLRPRQPGLTEVRHLQEPWPSTQFQPSTFNFEPSFSHNPNHSRTSETFSRKSNYSRTYAKTGGWGCLPQVQTGRMADRTDREDS
jgi:hypothetical protein